MAYLSGSMHQRNARRVPDGEGRARRVRAGPAACAAIMRRAFFSCHRR
ncbi:hypothetical protein BSIN_0345 [Burkholderia singularis]|uniref:Uncharacterized protein n=1 Tax=Burkholderia singularis TaxID=1503053 RepID=A0A238H658_9BURK|nr:hypothetical protein BSIN_0345 [Burkholderia singularis]